MKQNFMILSLLLLAPGLIAQQDSSQFQRWIVDKPHSTVGFDATSTLHNFNGTCSQVGGGAHADVNDLGRTSGGRIWCQASALNTQEEGRDENMWEDLEISIFPTLDFTISSLQGQLQQGSGTAQLSGMFSIHGVEQARTFPIQITATANGSLHIVGRVKFPMTTHGIEPHGVMGVVKVGDEVEAWVDLTLVRVPAEEVPATWIPLQVEETLRLPGSAAESTQLTANLFFTENTAFLDFEGVRSMSTSNGLQRILLNNLESSTDWNSNDTAFAASQARMERLQAKYDKLPASKRAKAGAKIKETLNRLQTSLISAPPKTGTVEIVKQETQTVLRLGNRDWVVLENLQGDAKVAALFASLEDLPAAVQEALLSVVGTPSKMTIHSATAAGARDMVFTFGMAIPKALPSWQFKPNTWGVTESH